MKHYNSNMFFSCFYSIFICDVNNSLNIVCMFYVQCSTVLCKKNCRETFPRRIIDEHCKVNKLSWNALRESIEMKCAKSESIEMKCPKRASIEIASILDLQLSCQLTFNVVMPRLYYINLIFLYHSIVITDLSCSVGLVEHLFVSSCINLIFLYCTVQ